MRRFMETRFGRDFDDVRIHAGAEAAAASRAIGAQAFAVGNHVVFGAGQYRPHTSEGRELIAHELAHVVQQGAGQPMVQRKLLYPAATVTATDDPISRFMGGDDSLALTTLTLNGAPVLGKEALARALNSALNPQAYEPRSAPTAATQAPHSGSGAGSGSGSSGNKPPEYCGFRDFDVSISANVRLPMPPDHGQWGPEAIAARAIKRGGLPQDCGKAAKINVVMKGDPDSVSFNEWVTKNENEHVSDMQQAAVQFLEPDHQAVMALRGTGADPSACMKNLDQQSAKLPKDKAVAFRDQIWADIKTRDAPGGHKFTVSYQESGNCSSLEILMKKMPAPKK
ncbi:MAG: DUF4157 domain-containing protein [Candidatus Korobacteraceae bacterium]